jgi:hypothetical protein
MKFWLVIIMTTEIGFGAGEPTYFKGPKAYEDLDTCMKRGEKAAQWLHQDFVTIKWECWDHDPGTTYDSRPQEENREPRIPDKEA